MQNITFVIVMGAATFVACSPTPASEDIPPPHDTDVSYSPYAGSNGSSSQRSLEPPLQEGVSPLDRIGQMQQLVRISGIEEDLVPIDFVSPRWDGVVAFSQPQDFLVRIYASSGEMLGKFGRSGEGPGEFAGISRLGWIADTLWVFDAIQQRLTYISPNLELVRTTASGLSRGTLGVTRDGGLIVGNSAPGDWYEFDRFSFDGQQKIGTIGRMPPGDHPQVRYPGGTVTIPYASTPHYAVSRNGEWLAYVVPSIEGPESGTFSVTVLSSNGNELFVSRFPFQGEEIPEADWNATIERRAHTLGRFGMSEQVDILRQAPKPRFFPPVSRILLGDDGTCWVELRGQADGVPYYVIDSGGTLVGGILLTSGDRVGAIISSNEVWVLEPDEFGTEDLVRYRVSW